MMITPQDLVSNTTGRERWLMRHVLYSTWAKDFARQGEAIAALYMARQSRQCIEIANNQ